MTGFGGFILGRRQAIAAAGALAVSLALAGCGSSESGSSGETVAAANLDGAIEKPNLKFGFIKLTDMAPLAIAKEKGFFAEEGLNVTLEPQANWKVLLDGVIGGQLDGAHMLAGQPIAATIGYGTKADLIAPLSMDLNGNAITMSNKVWDMIEPGLPKQADGKPKHPISASALKPVVASFEQQGKPFKMGMVFPVSTHNYELRYWLAAGGLNPGYYTEGDVGGTVDADVQLSVTPPPQMPATLEAGTIEGYCVGEPWNQAAVFKKIGVPVITDDEIWHDNPEKVFGLRKDFAEKYPATTAALLRAIIKAQQWLDADNGANRAEAVEILSRPNYVGADAEVIAASDDRQVYLRTGRHARREGLQHLLRQVCRLSLLFGCDLVPDPDAPLGPDRRRQVRPVVLRHRQGGLSSRPLSRRGEAAGRKGRDPGGNRA